MQVQRKFSKIWIREILATRKLYVLVAAILLLLIAILMPSGNWGPTPVSVRLGPQEFNPTLSKKSVILSAGSSTKPDTVTIRFDYLVSARPLDHSFLVSTSAKSYGGLKVSMDKWGNVYLSIETSNPILSEYQLVKISAPQELGVWFRTSIFIDVNDGVLDIKINDKSVPIGEARPSHAVSIPDFLLTNTEISIGGMDEHMFNGKIKDFTMEYGSSGIRIDLINLKLFLVLLALGLIGVFVNSKSEVIQSLEEKV